MWLLSPPCQPHTRQGMKRDCEDTRSDGLLHLISLLKNIKRTPDYILLENVEGFETSQSREMLLEVLEKLKYSVQEFILSPNQFQIPNQRDRYFLIARKIPFPIPPTDIPRLGPCYRVIPFHPTCVNISYKNGTAEMGTKESHELWSSLNSNCKSLNDFLDSSMDIGTDLTPYLVKQSVLQKSGPHLDIVTPDDKYSCCFTKAYRKYHRGTGSLLQTSIPYQLPPVARDFDNLVSLKLRYFTGTEMKRLHGFPEDFGFPDDMPETQRVKLVGNISLYSEAFRSLISEFECDCCRSIARISSEVLQFVSIHVCIHHYLLHMNSRFAFLVIAILSLPMFMWETILSIVNGNFQLFYYFTIITNALTWIYFVIKAVYVAFSSKVLVDCSINYVVYWLFDK